MSDSKDEHSRIQPLKHRYRIAMVVGSAFGLSTFFLKNVEGWGRFLIVLLFPGMFASMALSGNVHAFPLWLAAVANSLFYFGLTLLIWKVLQLFRRNKG